MNTFFKVDSIEIRSDQLFLIVGPCVIEEERLTMKIAEAVKKIGEEINLPSIFKASFDKANRSSIHSFRGLGLEEGLKILEKVKRAFDLPVLSDIHEAWQAEVVTEVLSAIQIPAFLSRQTDLLLAAAKTGLPVNVKKGQFMSAEDMFLVVEKLESTGNKKIMLTERGTFFGYHDLVVDFRNIPLLKKTGYPVVIDATHSVQRPSGAVNVSGGDPQHIPVVASAGVAAGANGVFVEVHPEPERALSDGSNSLHLKMLGPLLFRLKKIYNID